MRKSNEWDEAYRTGTYSEHWGITFPSQELVSFIATMNFPHGTVAVDVGCGAGQEAIFLAQQGFRVIGLDQSEEALKIATMRAKEAQVQVEWRQANILDLPLADQSVDMINDRGCFHVLPPTERDQYVSEMKRILKPRGYILLRGCRDVENDHFSALTLETLDHHFSPYFDHGPVLPIELSTGTSGMELAANIVVLKRKTSNN